jgi:Rieske Fe-S protein
MDNSFPLDNPALSRRQLLNFLTSATVAATAGSALYTASKFFIPPTESTEGGAILARDVLGNPIPVVRGPAPLPLKLVHVAVVENNILISPWIETDPRTGEKPWWV